MHQVFKKFRFHSRDEAILHILDTYHQQGFGVINYLYGAYVVSKHLRDDTKNDLTEGYRKALLNSDILFVDGIALQLLIFLYVLFYHKKCKRYTSINGTDFLPYFLQQAKKHYSLKLILYGAYPKDIERSAIFLKHRGYDVVYYQDGYRAFDWEKFIVAKKKQKQTIDRVVNSDNNSKTLNNNSTISNNDHVLRIFIQGRTTLTNPLQELWTLDNIDNIRQHGLLVCNQGGIFDHSTMGGKEKRAPKCIQWLKLERLWRTFINPKKGIGKLKATFGLIPLVFRKIVLKKQ